MKSWSIQLLAALALVLASWLAWAGAAGSADTVRNPDKLVILSTTDVKGRTSPCG